jgi:hypothetical protein
MLSGLLWLTAAALPAGAWAAPLLVEYGNLQFQSTGQSMWGAGNAPGLTIDRFLGVEWNDSATLGGTTGDVFTTSVPYPHPHLPSGWECHGFLCTGGHFHDPGGIHIHEADVTVDTRTGPEVDVSTSGKVGFQFGLAADSGSVDTQVEFAANLLVPDPKDLVKGEFFNLNPDSVLAGGQLATNFPELTASLDAVVGVRASATGTVCVPPAGCVDTSTGQLGFADQVVPLVSFNEDSNGQIKVLGQLDPALFQFDSEISIPGPSGGSLGGVTVHVPDINATGGVVGDRLVASGQDDLLKVTADLDGLVLAPLGLPGGGVGFNAGILSMSADLIDIDMGPIMKIVQDFEFSPTLWVDLLFDNPVLIAGLATPQMGWSGAWGALPGIALLTEQTLVTPTFSLQGLFTNNTALGIDGIFQLDILKAAFALEAFGLSFDLGELGPLVQFLERSNLFNTPPLFSSTYSLGGFNQITGASFLLSTATVPEPDTLVLIGLGLLALAGLRGLRWNGTLAGRWTS